MLSPSFFLQSSSPYVGRGSTNKVVEWYNILVLETRAYIREAGFDLLLAFFWRSLQGLPWCCASLRGGGILLTPFISLRRR